MLRQLSITNFVLIKHALIRWDEGMNVITGETGSGKSILIESLNLLLGERAGADRLFNPEKKCVLEAVFDLGKLDIRNFFQTNDLDYEEQTIVRRELLPGGKSRAFINDTPLPLKVLKAFGDMMVDIHSQFDNLMLNKKYFQLDLLDAFAKLKSPKKDYQMAYHNWRQLHQQIEEEKNRLEELEKEEDYLRFQWDETESLQLQQGEWTSLQEDLKIAENSAFIAQELAAAMNIYHQDEHGLEAQLSHISRSVKRLVPLMNTARSLSGRLESAAIELRDVAHELEALKQELNLDPEHLQELRFRADKINHIFNKHKIATEDEYWLFREELKKHLDTLASGQENLNQLKKEEARSFETLHKHAMQLRTHRKEAIKPFRSQLLQSLSQLGFREAGFEILLKPLHQPNSSGMDEVSFLFSANLGKEPEEISKVASGGERSRLMLSLKAMATEEGFMPTLVFDEIDSGVSGDIAAKVGQMMKSMAAHKQLIFITHLPQIAAYANRHLKVLKKEEAGQTTTHVVLLDEAGRREEIAALLSDEHVGEIALEAANQLIERAK